MQTPFLFWPDFIINTLSQDTLNVLWPDPNNLFCLNISNEVLNKSDALVLLEY